MNPMDPARSEHMHGPVPADIEQFVGETLRFVRQVAAVLPIDKADEAIVSQRLAARTQGLVVRPLTRKLSTVP